MKRKPHHVVVAIPAYTGQVHCGTMRSVLHDVMKLYARGDVVQVAEEIGNADISMCRAVIVAKFLEIKGATHLVMVDSDVCWQSGGLLRLLDAGEDFVCGAYPKRTGDEIQFHMHLMKREAQSLAENGLLEVEAMPAGFMCVSRRMLERMVERYGDLKIAFPHVPAGYVHDLFDGFHYLDTAGVKHKLGEDYSFCRRWREMGGRIFVDPDIHMGHLGTKIWQGRLADGFKPTEAKAA